MKDKARAAILQLIEKEREGDQIDRALLKNVLDIFIEVGMNTMEAYEADFEAALLIETAEFYKRKAAAWIQVQDLQPLQTISVHMLSMPSPETVTAAPGITQALSSWRDISARAGLACFLIHLPGEDGCRQDCCRIAQEGLMHRWAGCG